MNLQHKNIYIPSKKGNLTVAQFSDLHLGAKFSDFNKINPLTGNNCQWDDQIDALRKATQLVVDSNPAVAIYPGDIFDRASNIPEKLLAAFQESLLSLIKNDIAVVMFTGNHDFPKSREYKALISRYDGIGDYLNTVSIYKAQYETVNINDDILIHCIPQCFSKEQFKEELDKVQSDHSYPINILTTHIGVQGAGINEYEHAEAWINKLELDLDFDHIALGDYHRPLKVSEKCAYAGVLSKGNFSDKDSKHGVIIFDGENSSMNFLEYQVRGMQQYNIDCSELEPEDIDEQVKEIFSDFDRDCYLKIEFQGISKIKQRQLEFKNIHDIKKEAYYCKISYVYKEEEKQDSPSSNNFENKTSTLSIPEEFKVQLSKIVTDKSKIDKLMKLYEDICKNA